MSIVEPPFQEKDLGTDAVSKKDIVTFLQTHASEKFKGEHKLKGTLVNVAKVKTKDQLIKDYKEFFETKAFRTAEDDSAESKPKENVRKPQAKDAKDAKHVESKQVETKPKVVPAKKPEEVKYQKKILKVGDKCTFPNKGEEVGCYYTGKLSDGKVFDTNVPTDKNAKKTNPLKFKVGTGKVIRGWDEAIQSMSLGEKAEVVIHPDWAYGKKGLEGKIPPNSQLTFEIELVSIV